MTKKNGKCGRNGARTDAEEAVDDSQAELDDIAAALNTSVKPAGESTDEGSRPPLPDGLLMRKYEKGKIEKEKALQDAAKAIKEKNLMEKQLEDMKAQWQSELANNAKVGDVVELSTPCSSKVRSKLL